MPAPRRLNIQRSKLHANKYFNPPNSKVWGSLLEKGNAPGSPRGGARIGAQCRVGGTVPDGWHRMGGCGAGSPTRHRVPGPDAQHAHADTERRAPTQRDAGERQAPRQRAPKSAELQSRNNPGSRHTLTEIAVARYKERGPRHKERRGPALGPDTKSAAPRAGPRRHRARAPTQRAPGPDTPIVGPGRQPLTESAGPNTKSAGDTKRLAPRQRAPGPDTQKAPWAPTPSAASTGARPCLRFGLLCWSQVYCSCSTTALLGADDEAAVESVSVFGTLPTLIIALSRSSAF